MVKKAPPRKPATKSTYKVSDIAKKYKGKVGINTYKSNAIIDVIPTGSLSLDIATGVGGLPRGRITEISGMESSGKSTLTMSTLAKAQKLGYTCALIDAEYSFDPVWAKGLGVEPETLIVLTPENFEDAANITIDLIKEGIAQVVVFDSIAALDVNAATEGVVGDSQMGKKPQYISQWLRLVTPYVYKNAAWLILINQLRMKMNATKYEDPYITTGGAGIPFASSLRIRLRATQEKVGTGADQETIGAKVNGRVFKNKVSPPHKKFHYVISFTGGGIDNYGEVADILVDNYEDFGIIKSGSWYTLPVGLIGNEEPIRVQGANGIENLFEDASTFDKLVDVIRRKLIKNEDAGARNHTGEVGDDVVFDEDEVQEEPNEDMEDEI